MSNHETCDDEICALPFLQRAADAEPLRTYGHAIYQASEEFWCIKSITSIRNDAAVGTEIFWPSGKLRRNEPNTLKRDPDSFVVDTRREAKIRGQSKFRRRVDTMQPAFKLILSQHA